MAKQNNKNGRPCGRQGNGGRTNRSDRSGGRRNNRSDFIKRNPTKDDRREVEIDDTVKKMRSTSNPYEFYSEFPQFARDSATLPFATPLGSTLQVGNTAFGDSQFTIPGLMNLRFYPVVGVSSDFTSPMNRSSIRFFTYLRSIQKASWKYDHQDVTMMITALDSLICFHDLNVRAYRCMNLFTPVNSYYPRALVAAMGFDYNDLKRNMADWRLYIDQLGFNIGQYAIPTDIKLIARHRWMVNGLYCDSTSTRAQTYMFTPQGFWKYNGTVETGSELNYVDWLGTQSAPTLHKFSDIVEFGNSLINAVSDDQDFAAISGDLYSFYNGNVLHLQAVSELEAIVPIYDEIVMSQIENARICGFWEGSYIPKISQNPDINAGAIIFQPVTSDNQDDAGLDSAALANAKLYMNFHHDSPTPEQVMEASRLMVQGHNGGTGKFNQFIIDECGTEIICAADMWFINPTTGAFRFLQRRSSAIIVYSSQFNATDWSTTCAFYQFDWAPMLEVWESAEPFTFLGWLADIDNFSQISTEQLHNMHTAALYSLWNITEKGARDRA